MTKLSASAISRLLNAKLNRLTVWTESNGSVTVSTEIRNNSHKAQFNAKRLREAGYEVEYPVPGFVSGVVRVTGKKEQS